jgi:hypothetical protein
VFIPLDYYRILGLPLQATTSQLQQAHRDRSLQLPRQEYSDAAIAARKVVLDQAYNVLSNPERRHAYDQTFLANTYETEPVSEVTSQESGGLATRTGEAVTPQIEVDDQHFVGALLLLQELGEYELVLRLGRPFLTGGSSTLKDGQYGDPALVYPDIVLTVALACLELGREQWQQGQYENAAEALDTGQRLLLREGLFAGVRGEIQSDLYKLRPYRVLEALSQPSVGVERRYMGLQLLQEMLQERGGIDGSGDDQSGLAVDDFLRFIQQLRGYMTVAEQQVLFEEEARRPSAVATYLAVYALLARGFAEHEPSLVRRSHQLLQRLSNRQDVYLEQAVCHLLLGQPEAANRSLEFSQEQEPIAFIRDHSQGSPDLLPGLCLYTERWLQEEVFPHFADLAQRSVSLKDYFADLGVQQYLETLANDPSSFDVPAPAPAASPLASSARSVSLAPDNASTHPEAQGYVSSTEDADALIAAARARIAAGAGAAGSHVTARSSRHVAVSTAERISPTTEGATIGTASHPRGSAPAKTEETATIPPATGDLGRVVRRLNRSKRGGQLRWIFPLGIVLAFLAAGFLGARLISSWASSALKSESRRPQPAETLTPSVEPSPSPSPSVAVNPAVLDNQSAKQVIATWLAAKAAAMGPDYAVEKLDTILTGRKLTEWRQLSNEEKRNNRHRTYTHEVAVSEVKQAEGANQATVMAKVQEATTYFVAGQRDRSNTSNLQVRYELIRKDGKWQIQNWDIL